MNKEQVRNQVVKQLDDYLKRHQKRRTPERYKLLQYIYDSDGVIFDAEMLYIALKSVNYRISLATIYNCLEILVKAEILKKNHFTQRTAQYEKLLGQPTFDHIICSKCGRIKAIHLKEMDGIQNCIEEELKFKLKYRTLSFYSETCIGSIGKCSQDDE